MSVNRTPVAVSLMSERLVQFGLSLGLTAEQIAEAALNLSSKNKEQEGTSLAPGNLAQTRNNWFQNWYRELGFNLSVPLPAVSDKEFSRRGDLGQDLFYRPSSSMASYEALMTAVGQSNHWTLTHGDREKVVWEPTATGYWFWAEVAQDCPRLGTPWNKLTKVQKLNLLSLEEYVIVWWAHKAATNVMLDAGTWSWLRTRFGRGALHAYECDGRVDASRWNDDVLACPYDFAGGRVAEVVKM